MLVGGVRRQGGEEEHVARRPQPHPVGQVAVPQGIKELRGGQQAIADKAQGPARPRAAQQQYPVVAAEDGLPQGIPPGKPGGELLHQGPGGGLLPLELQVSGVQQGLVRGVPEIQAVLIDKVLDHRGHQSGDVPVQVHVLPDTGGADVLQVGGQLQMEHLAGDGQLFGQRFFPGPAEDHVVHPVDGPGAGRGLIAGGVGHHVAARHNVQLLAGEQLAEPVQVLGVGDVHRDVVGEQVDVEVPRHGQVDDLPPDEMGLGLFGPGELVHRQIDLKAQVPDGLDDALVGQGEGVEGAGEEGDLSGRLEGEWAMVQPVQGDEPVDVGQGGGPIEEGQAALVRRLQNEKQQLAVAQGEQAALLPQGQLPGLEQQLADDQQGLLPHRLPVVSQALEKQTQQLLPPVLKGGVGLGEAL